MNSRPSTRQWEVLLNYLEKNPDMVSGRLKGPQGKQLLRENWNALANSLNSLGYANKTPDKWLKTWTDFKYHIKRKAAEIKKDQNKTGGGPPSCKFLSELEERALQLLGTTFLGLDISEVGLPTTDCNQNVELFLEDQPSTSTNVTAVSSPFQLLPPNFNEHTYSRHKPKHSGERDNVNDAYNETINILKDINNTLDVRLTEISVNLKEIAKNTEKKHCQCCFCA